MNVDTYTLANSTLRNFVETSYEAFGSYSYSAGYLQSLLATCLADMKKKDAQRVIKQLQEAAERLRVSEQSQLENK